MFTRSMFNTTDIEQQSQLLHQVAELVDNHRIKTTLNQTLGKINAQNLKLAHELIESGRAKGKIVLEGREKRVLGTYNKNVNKMCFESH